MKNGAAAVLRSAFGQTVSSGGAIWVYTEKKRENMYFRKILYKVYTFLIDFLTLRVILTIEQMKQESFEIVTSV